MQSRVDASLRKMIQDEKTSLKVKRECLAAMENPSAAFLAEIVNGVYPPKLRLDAGRRLSAIQQAKEIDRILREETERLKLKAAAPAPAPVAEQRPILAARSTEPQPCPPERETTKPLPQTAQPTPAVPLTEQKSKNEQLFDGRKLAAAIEFQMKRCNLAPANREECERLENLRLQFERWELEAAKNGIDVAVEFGVKLETLRPVRINTTPSKRRQTLNAWELHTIGCQQSETHRDTSGEGMWSGLPPGI